MPIDKTDILIVGGGPAGIVAAVSARKSNPDKDITLVRENKRHVIPCGIPYIFNRLKSVAEDEMPDKPLEVNEINLIIDKVIKIDSDEKKVFFEKTEELHYEKLILATGSKSISVPIEGIDKEGVWKIANNFEYLEKLREAVVKSKNVLIIGGGFIGVELAEELSGISGLNISIIEKSEYCLSTTFDEPFAITVEERLKEKGVNLYTSTVVEEIVGEGNVESVRLGHEEIPADLVIVSIGAKPNTDLAKESGISLGGYGGIEVNEYLETDIKDIFAIGDCAETRCFLTKKYIPIMLASTACHEARIAASNLYKRERLIHNDGTLAVFSTCIDGLAIGIAGLNEKRAKEEGFDIVVGESKAPNHHPGTLPNTQEIKVKLIFCRDSGDLLGGQIMGPESVGEMINILALAIQQETDVYNFDVLQIASHPLLTAAPTIYPLITAAQSALTQIINRNDISGDQ